MPGKKSASWQLVVFVMWLKNDTKRQKTTWNCQNQNRRKYSPDQQSYFFCCHRYWNFSGKIYIYVYVFICTIFSFSIIMSPMSKILQALYLSTYQVYAYCWGWARSFYLFLLSGLCQGDLTACFLVVERFGRFGIPQVFCRIWLH